MYSIRTTLVIAVLLALLVVFAPAAAYALDTGDVLSFGASTVLTIIYDLLDLVHKLIMFLINGIGTILKGVINLAPGTGGAPVYTMWRILRDFCNMAFIVVLILISFATIFGVFKIPVLSAFTLNKSVITGFLMAALLLNFSMAIGQTVIIASNQAVKLVLTVLPKDLGAAIAQSVGYASGNISGLATTKPPIIIDNVSIEGLTPAQNRAVALYADINLRNAVTDCIKNNVDLPYNCYNRIVLPRIQSLQANAIALEESGSNPLVFSPMTALRCLGDWGGLGTTCALPDKPQGDPFTLMKMIAEKTLVIFLALILAISLVAVFAFMVVRIPYLWVLLAISPLAYVSLAFPGSKGFGEWWKQFWGWNIFAPLYLFVIYLGMILINATSAAVSSLAPVGGTVPLIAGALGSLFSYSVVGIVFVLGGIFVMKTSFASGTYAATIAGKITGGLGFTKGGGAAGAVYKFTGLQARVTGAGAGIASVYKSKITEPLARREAEATARYQKLFGDKSALEGLERKRIKEQLEKNKERGVAMADLEKDFKKGPSAGAKYFAAADALLSEGKLSGEQMVEYQNAASRISPSYRNAVKEKVEKKLKDTGKEKQFKYKDAREALAVLDRYRPDPSNRDAGEEEQKKKMFDEIRKKIEQTQPLLAAELAKEKGLYVNPNGEEKTPSQIIESNFKSLNNKDLLALLEKGRKGELTVTPAMNEMIAGRVKKLEDYKTLVNTATPEQQVDIAHIAADEIEKQRNAKKTRPRRQRQTT